MPSLWVGRASQNNTWSVHRMAEMSEPGLRLTWHEEFREAPGRKENELHRFFEKQNGNCTGDRL